MDNDEKKSAPGTSKALTDLVATFIVSVAVFVVAFRRGVLERLAEWASYDVAWEASELAILVAIVPLSLGIFALRRWGDYRNELARRREAEDLLKQSYDEIGERVEERTRELCESKERLRHILSSNPAVIYTAKSDYDGGVTFVSENVAAQLGYEPSQWSGNDSFWKNHLHPEDVPRFFQETSAIFEKGYQAREYRFRHKDGKYRWIRDEAKLLRDEEGNPVEIIGFWTDITDRKTSEEALRETETRYRELAELLPQFVFETDLTGRLTFVNQAGLEACGHTQADFPQEATLPQFFTPEDRERGAETVNRILLGEKITGEEFVMLGKDGAAIPMILYANPVVRQHQIMGMRGVGVDVSRLKAAEDRIKTTLREKEVLVREVHHRVKNNLQVMSSLLRLQSRYVTDHSTIDALRDSENRIGAMALIHEKLYQSDNLGKISTPDFIGNIAHHLVGAFGSRGIGKRLQVDVQDTFFGIETAVPLGLIVTELVSNALTHAFPNEKQGEIRVVLRSKDEDSFELIVSDNGVGLPSDVDITRPNSMGFDLVFSLVRQIHAQINVDSSRGTEFRIEFKEVKPKGPRS